MNKLLLLTSLLLSTSTFAQTSQSPLKIEIIGGPERTLYINYSGRVQVDNLLPSGYPSSLGGVSFYEGIYGMFLVNLGEIAIGERIYLLGGYTMWAQLPGTLSYGAIANFDLTPTNQSGIMTAGDEGIYFVTSEDPIDNWLVWNSSVLIEDLSLFDLSLSPGYHQTVNVMDQFQNVAFTYDIIVSQIPEPSTYALLLAVAGVTAAGIRRRKKNAN